MRIVGYVAEKDKEEGRGTKPPGPAIETKPVKDATGSVDVTNGDFTKPAKHVYASKKVNNPDAE